MPRSDQSDIGHVEQFIAAHDQKVRGMDDGKLEKAETDRRQVCFSTRPVRRVEGILDASLKMDRRLLCKRRQHAALVTKVMGRCTMGNTRASRRPTQCKRVDTFFIDKHANRRQQRYRQIDVVISHVRSRKRKAGRYRRCQSEFQIPQQRIDSTRHWNPPR